jgi:hypothetical protein
MTTFSELFEQLDPDENRRGKQFERICQWFLTHDPVYAAADRQVTSRRRFLAVAAAAIRPSGSVLRSASGRGCLGWIPPMDEVARSRSVVRFCWGVR